MQTRERHISRPEAAAIARAASFESASTRDRAEIARLTRDLAEMREDRDRWRTQAERLSSALDRLKAPAAAIVPAPVAPAATVPEKAGDDILHGMPAIAAAFGWRQRQAYHLKDEHELPTFKIGRIVCARRGAIAAWLAEREAASMEGR